MQDINSEVIFMTSRPYTPEIEIVTNETLQLLFPILFPLTKIKTQFISNKVNWALQKQYCIMIDDSPSTQRAAKASDIPCFTLDHPYVDSNAAFVLQQRAMSSSIEKFLDFVKIYNFVIDIVRDVDVSIIDVMRKHHWEE